MNATLRSLGQQRFDDPPIAKFLFGSPIMGFLWFLVRLFVGWQWLTAGLHKVTGDSSIGWVPSGEVGGKTVQAGDAILGFWQRAVAIPQSGRPAITYDWYRDVLQFMIDQHWNTWFGYVIAYGELLIGIALIIGLFTAFASLVGATLNFNFLLAGTASTNPVLFLGAVVLILAWKNAGYLGLDRWLLPALGTPWQPGRIFHRATGATGAAITNERPPTPRPLAT